MAPLWLEHDFLASAASLCLGFLACLSLGVLAFAVQQGWFQACHKLFPSMLPLFFPMVESPTQQSMETQKLAAFEGHSWHGGVQSAFTRGVTANSLETCSSFSWGDCGML